MCESDSVRMRKTERRRERERENEKAESGLERGGREGKEGEEGENDREGRGRCVVNRLLQSTKHDLSLSWF